MVRMLNNSLVLGARTDPLKIPALRFLNAHPPPPIARAGLKCEIARYDFKTVRTLIFGVIAPTRADPPLDTRARSGAPSQRA